MLCIYVSLCFIIFHILNLLIVNEISLVRHCYIYTYTHMYIYVCVYWFDVCVTVHHQYNDVNNQQDATTFSFINLFKSAQHVSGDKFAHPQERFLTVYTAFGTMHRLCCRPVQRLKWQYIYIAIPHKSSSNTSSSLNLRHGCCNLWIIKQHHRKFSKES